MMQDTMDRHRSSGMRQRLDTPPLPLTLGSWSEKTNNAQYINKREWGRKKSHVVDRLVEQSSADSNQQQISGAEFRSGNRARGAEYKVAFLRSKPINICKIHLHRGHFDSASRTRWIR